jgi:hypothetical protein
MVTRIVADALCRIAQSCFIAQKQWILVYDGNALIRAAMFYERGNGGLARVLLSPE